jgi:hypothetical protein
MLKIKAPDGRLLEVARKDIHESAEELRVHSLKQLGLPSHFVLTTMPTIGSVGQLVRSLSALGKRITSMIVR